MFVPIGKIEVSVYFMAAGLFALLLYMVWKLFKYMKLYAEFPTFLIVFYIVYFAVTNKIPKHLPFAAFFFQKLVLLAERFHQEQLYLLWAPEPILLVFGENTVKAFINDQEILDKPSKYGFLREFYGTGLLTSDVDTWKKHRKLLNPVFHVGMLKHKMEIFNNSADKLVKKLGEEAANEAPIDAFDLIQSCAFGVLSEYVFGLERNASENKELLNTYIPKLKTASELVINTIGQPWLQFKILRKFFSSGRKYAMLIDDLHNLSMKGFDTISHAILWSIFLLGHDLEVQNRAYDEVSTLLEERIKYEDLQNLVYLECIIKETLRLYPSVPAYGRKLNKDIQCGKYIVPKGTDVIIFAFMLHRNRTVYPEPEKFDPERFLDGSTSIRSENYVPFGHGIRNCIGKGFAMIEMKVILAYILRNFKITSLERREDVDITWDVALLPVKPLHFRFTPRKYHDK